MATGQLSLTLSGCGKTSSYSAVITTWPSAGPCIASSIPPMIRIVEPENYYNNEDPGMRNVSTPEYSTLKTSSARTRTRASSVCSR